MSAPPSDAPSRRPSGWRRPKGPMRSPPSDGRRALPRSHAGHDDPVVEGEQEGPRAGGHPDVGEESADGGLYGRPSHVEPRGDLGIRAPARHEAQDVVLALGKELDA